MRFSLAVAPLVATAILFGHSGIGAATVGFSDQTVSAGMSFTPGAPVDMDSREMYPGGSVGDFNRDGWPDVFLLGGGLVADALFINNGDGTFTDLASDWGVDFVHRGRGSTVGDYNNDGWPDIYVTSGGDLSGADRFGQHRLYENNGTGSFTERGVAAGVNETSLLHTTATGAAFGDYDLDGDLDLFVAGWEVTGCALFACDQNRLFRNNGDETFTDVTDGAGIVNSFPGFSPRFLDMNGDRYPELLIAADYGNSRYFVNNGDGTFTDQTAASGTGLDDAGMGSAIADFNGDLLPDWYVTSIFSDSGRELGNYLYFNQGNDSYIELPAEDGARNGGWGWGVEGADIDHDGWVDVVETNGWWIAEWMVENSYLFQNQGGGSSFTEIQVGSGFTHYGQGRTMLKLDYDRDGDMDFVVTAFDERVQLFRNDLSGSDINWIEIALDTSTTPWLAPDGYGAQVTATAGGVSRAAWADGGATYLGRSQHIVHFGLSNETLVDIVVDWSDGSATSMPGLSTNQIVTASPPVFGGAPGEASSDPVTLMKADHDAATGEVLLEYTPACDASNHTIYYGQMADIATHGYSHAVCWLGNSGSVRFDPGRDTFFVIVGHNGTVEGSFGLFGPGSERPEATGLAGCEIPQDLTGTCDVP